MAKPEQKTETKYSRYEAAQKERGLKKIHIWVPITDVDKAKKYAERLRKTHANKEGK